MSIRFIHTSDWHLGFNQYNKPERFDDFFQAVSKSIKQMIKLEPDFILHTGDIFHHPQPNPAAIRQCIVILKQLQDARIPFYTIRGNHDGKDSIYLSRGGGIISLLSELELLHFVDDSIETITGVPVELIGIGYYPGKGVTKKVDELIQQSEGRFHDKIFTILALHAFVEGQLEEYSQVSLNSVSDMGIDYIGAGHYHIPWRKDEKRVYAPGSSETTAITDANRLDIINQVSLYSSFYEVNAVQEDDKWLPPNVTEHRVVVRPKILLNHATSAQTPEQIRQEIEELLDEKLDTILMTEGSVAELRPILRISLQTQLSFEQNSQLNFEEWFGEDYLHILSSIDGKSSDLELVKELHQSIHVEEVFIELLKLYELVPEDHLTTMIDLKESLSSITNRELNYQQLWKISEMISGETSSIVTKFKLEAEKELAKEKEAEKVKELKKEKKKDKKKKEKKSKNVVVEGIDSTDDNQLGLDVFDDLDSMLEDY